MVNGGRKENMEQPSGKIGVLFIMMQMEMGGSERLVHDLALNMDRKFFNPSVAWFYGNRVLEQFEELDVPLYHVPKSKRFDFSTMCQLANIIKDNNIQVVNAHHFMSMVYSFYGCKIRNNVKLVYTEHSKWEIEQVPLRWRVLGRFLLNHIDAAVGVNEEVTKSLRNKFNLHPSKAFTIQNGVDLEVFGNRNESRGLRNELGISNGEKVIGIVANLKKIKNHMFLLKAFEELLKEYENVKLLLIGQGLDGDIENSEAEVRHFTESKGLEKNVLFLGFRSDIPDLLGIMDVFCLTSFKEGLPISLIEAMAAGLPVVGSDVEGIRNVIIHDKNGFLVEAGDVMGLRDALIRLLENDSLRIKMGQESKDLANRIYSFHRCLHQYQNLFTSISN
jgi:glycosyltransferase involved in cell wall biosynthesis